jgi:hypothetical protein
MAGITLEYVKRMADQLTADDKLSLVEHMAKQLRQTQERTDTPAQEAQRTPQDLYGIWRDAFPPDLDIDGILYEIRHEWEEEWPEVFKR